MTIRTLLVGIGLFLWAGAAAWWTRATRIHDPALKLRQKQAIFAAVMGVPFFIAGAFFTASSYPGDVIQPATPAPFAVSVPAATPAPLSAAETLPVSPASHDQAVTAAQYEAVHRFPQLGVAGTPFNRAFVAAVGRLKRTESAYFDDDEWPLKLAAEIDAQLLAAPESEPAATPFPKHVEGGFHRD